MKRFGPRTTRSSTFFELFSMSPDLLGTRFWEHLRRPSEVKRPEAIKYTVNDIDQVP
jgi:hypothetical protein